MIVGAHSVIYSKDAEADRAFVREVLGFPHVDVGGGWLIFALPSAELAFHPSGGDPSDGGGNHVLFLMCDDIVAFCQEMSEKGVHCSAIHEERWGRLVEISLPGGGRLGVYEAKHERPGKPA
ncbi:MAG: extradiol dioxygenase [Acidobacteria bacterium]|nr:extradiol dioxygenase [Acidobacteriota bacterium]